MKRRTADSFSGTMVVHSVVIEVKGKHLATY